MTQKRAKYLTKTVKFGSKSLTLYSLDGLTWSSRRDELQAIKERQEAQRVTFAEIKGTEEEETVAKPEVADNTVEPSGDEEETAPKRGRPGRPAKNAVSSEVKAPKKPIVASKFKEVTPKVRPSSKPLKKQSKLRKKAA